MASAISFLSSVLRGTHFSFFQPAHLQVPPSLSLSHSMSLSLTHTHSLSLCAGSHTLSLSLPPSHSLSQTHSLTLCRLHTHTVTLSLTLCASPIGCTSCFTKSLGPVNPSFRALSGRLKFTVRRDEFNNFPPPTSRGPVDPSFRALSGRLQFTVISITIPPLPPEHREQRGGPGAQDPRERRGGL